MKKPIKIKKHSVGALLAIEYILLICLVVVAMCTFFPGILNILYTGTEAGTGNGGLTGIVNNIIAQLEECCSAPGGG